MCLFVLYRVWLIVSTESIATLQCTQSGKKSQILQYDYKILLKSERLKNSCKTYISQEFKCGPNLEIDSLDSFLFSFPSKWNKGHQTREGEDRHMANVALNQLPNKRQESPEKSYHLLQNQIIVRSNATP